MRGRLAVAVSICAMAALIFASQEVLLSCRSALTLCCELIIPSLFPFFLLSIFMNRLKVPLRLGKLLAPFSKLVFGVSGSGGTALVMGLCGGYPLGAAYIADMRKNGLIECDEAERLLAFCNNSGPAFIIGAIGTGIFRSSAVGLYLYGVHIASAMITGLFFRRGGVESDNGVTPPTALPFAQAFTEAVKDAVISVLNVCGYVVCFTVLVGLLDADGFFSLIVGRLSQLSGGELHWVRAFLTGILELGSGTGQMQGLKLLPINLALAAFLVGWGGLSVHFQTMAQIADTDIKGSYHFAGRLICASIAALLAYFCAGIII